MPIANVDPKLAASHKRALTIEQERRETAESRKDLRTEMKSAGLSKAEIGGIFLAVRREFESEDKAAARTAEEEVADMLAASGTAPLFAARAVA